MVLFFQPMLAFARGSGTGIIKGSDGSRRGDGAEEKQVLVDIFFLDF
jgi:hypothetical protein